MVIIIYTFLIGIPLNTGCSYMIFKALLKDKISVFGMFEGAKFCKKTRIIFVGICILQELTMYFLLNYIPYTTHIDLTSIFIFMHSVLFYIIHYRVSFMRYYSMEGYYYNKPLDFKSTVEGSLKSSKNTTIIYLLIKILFMLLGLIMYYLLINNLSAIFIYVYNFVYLICARILDESLRISIFQLNRVDFHTDKFRAIQ